MIMQPSFLLIAETIPVGSLLSSLSATNNSLCCTLSQGTNKQYH